MSVDLTVERDEGKCCVRLIMETPDGTVTLEVDKTTAVEVGSLFIRQAAALPNEPRKRPQLTLLQGGKQ